MNGWSEALITATSWMLLHSLWQFGLVYLLVILLLRIIPENLPHLRYFTALLGIVSMTGWATITWGHHYYRMVDIPAAVEVSTVSDFNDPEIPLPVTSPTEVRSVQSAFHWNIIKTWLNQHITWVFKVWLVLFILQAIRLTSGLYKIRQLNQSRLVDPRLNLLLDNLKNRIRINRPVQVKLSPQVKSPWVTGIFHPIILMPFNVSTGLTPEQLENILLHELVHIKHQDYLVNLIQNMIGTLFFFNPFLIWINHSIRFERECRCDQVSLKYTHKEIYRNALLEVVQKSLQMESLSVAALGQPRTLLKRFERLHQSHNQREKIWLQLTIVIAAALMTFLTFHLNGQDPKMEAPPQIELENKSQEPVLLLPPPPQDLDTIMNRLRQVTNNSRPGIRLTPNSSNHIKVSTKPGILGAGLPKLQLAYSLELAKDLDPVRLFINGKHVDAESGFKLDDIKTVSVELNRKTRKKFAASPDLRIWIGRGERSLNWTSLIAGEIKQWPATMARPGDYFLVTARDTPQDTNTTLLRVPIVANKDKTDNQNTGNSGKPGLDTTIKVFINGKEIDRRIGFTPQDIETISFKVESMENGSEPNDYPEPYDQYLSPQYATEIYLARGSRPLVYIKSESHKDIHWNLSKDKIKPGDRLVVRMEKAGKNEPKEVFAIPVYSDEIYVNNAENLAKQPSNVKVIINGETIDPEHGYAWDSLKPVNYIRLEYQESDFRKLSTGDPITVKGYLARGSRPLIEDDGPDFENIIQALNHSFTPGSRLVFNLKNTASEPAINIPIRQKALLWAEIDQKKYTSGQIESHGQLDQIKFGFTDPQVFGFLQGETLAVEMMVKNGDKIKAQATYNLEMTEETAQGFHIAFNSSPSLDGSGQKFPLIDVQQENNDQIYLDISVLKSDNNRNLMNLTIELNIPTPSGK
ncbi:MAG: M56 family metallopeptidase [Candidatus Cyclobacteriaceae bacterium M3_2C_046]